MPGLVESAMFWMSSGFFLKGNWQFTLIIFRVLRCLGFTLLLWFCNVVLMGMMYTGAIRIVGRGQDNLIHHLLGGDIGCQIHHLSLKWRTEMHSGSSLCNHKHDRSILHYCGLVSVTSAVILPKITVGHCLDVVAVDVVPHIALITVYCSVSPDDFNCTTSTWIVCWQAFTCIIGVLFKWRFWIWVGVYVSTKC